MFTQIKTSSANREVVAQLTRKLNLGKENIIARIAYTYSLSKDRKLDLTKIEDSGGKEYSKSVLFGVNLDVYLGLLCVNYGLSKKDKDIPKLIKMHIDDGLELMKNEIQENSSIDGFDYVIKKINFGLNKINL
ncbi:DndE family protein [Polaribacter sp. Hel_I_88]|uniref:DndE family protein n=1 Tax=Polaribacter sp. Hel_I_88 TaxID=1250006 RepID=UPI00047EF83F|nr:DndE family protein [Polaribacter sp. Hel_I_88]